jgi:hypothetical protein
MEVDQHGNNTEEGEIYEEVDQMDQDDTAGGRGNGGGDGGMADFTNAALKMCEIEDKIKELNSQKKALADEKNELKERVIEFMKVENVRIDYGDEVIFLREKTVKGSLTRKKLKELLMEYHNLGDEDMATEDGAPKSNEANTLLAYIDENLGETQKFDLVRQKVKQETEKKAKKENEKKKKKK